MSGGLLHRPWRFEAALLLAGAAVVAAGAPVARGGSALALLPADLLIVAIAAGVAVVARSAPAGERRFAALAGMLVVLVAVPVTRIPSPGETIVALGIAAVVLTVLGLRGGALRLPRGWPVAAALVLLLAAVTAVAPDRFGLLRFAPFVLAVVPVTVLAGGLTAAARRRTMRLVVLLGVVEAVLALAEPLLRSPQLWAPAKITAAGIARTLPNPLLPELARSQGTMGHPLVLGVLLLVALALVLRTGTGLAPRLRGGAAALLVAGLLVSGSRNGLLIAAVLAVVLLPRWRWSRRAVALAALVAAVAGALAVALAPVLAGWAATGSATHRLGALEAVGGLLRQPPAQLLLGNGWASTGRMFAGGMLQGDGLEAVDQQFVLLLSQGGLVAVALLVALVVVALRHADRASRPSVLAVVLTFLVFDALAWPGSAALAALLLAAPAGRRSRVAVPGAAQPRRAYSR